MESKLRSKYDHLIILLKQYGRAAVAFSGGVDSTFLARAAHDALDDNAVAVTVDSQAYPAGSLDETRKLADLIGIRLIVLTADVRDIPNFCDNPPDRCYHCKKALFTLMLEAIRDDDYLILMDGSNVDDDDDYRPGHLALKELDIKSPLRESGMTKSDIREISREMGLPTWNMQSFACLASRFPYNDHITPELLDRTAKAEELLHSLGVARYRVRNHGDMARIEVDQDGFNTIRKIKNRKTIIALFKSLGYQYITLDLEGYRTGSMNEPLLKDD